MAVLSEAEVKVLVEAGAFWARFSERISRLPRFLQQVLFADLSVAVEERLRVLEAAQK